MSVEPQQQLAERLAILAPVLYLLNLLLLPGLAFLVLLCLHLRYRHINSALARVQLRQNVYASIVAGLAIVGISLIIMFIGGLSSVYSWMLMLIYALSIHATLVLFGALSLARSLNQQTYIYPGLSALVEHNTETG